MLVKSEFILLDDKAQYNQPSVMTALNSPDINDNNSEDYILKPILYMYTYSAYYIFGNHLLSYTFIYSSIYRLLNLIEH